MDSEENDQGSDPPPSFPTIRMESPPTVVTDGQRLKLQQKQIEESLLQAKKKFTDEEFADALSTLKILLQSDPNLEPAKALQSQIEQAAANRARDIFDQGLNSFMECDWDRATTLWKKTLSIVPEDAAALDWIAKAERKKEQEKLVRAELLKELEACGKVFSDRNYVAVEERLESMKNRFTGGFRLADLQRIYESLLVRTRIELEKEFEDLRSNVVETPAPAPVQRKSPPGPKTREEKIRRQYMESFEAGKNYFEMGQWARALAMWKTARQINPSDANLIHWIALAENNLLGLTPQKETSPVRSTFAFLSVFVITALIAFLAYQKYRDYSTETKNQALIQRAIEHYRAGRLEESRRTLQIDVLQDPKNEFARALLERITSEMNTLHKLEAQYRETDLILQKARSESKSQNYSAAMDSYQQILERDPAHKEAQQEYEQLKSVVDSSQTNQRVANLLKEGEALLTANQLDAAEEKFNLVRAIRPNEPKANNLLDRIQSSRNHMNRIAAQLEVARFLLERNQKDSAMLVLNRILAADPGQPQAKQLISRIRGTSNIPRAQLEIRIQPAARLWIDGRDAGFNSYFNLMESIGTHIIHIETSGFKSMDQGLEVKNGKNQFQFQLKPQ